jgi:site-specific DNA recombinase
LSERYGTQQMKVFEESIWRCNKKYAVKDEKLCENRHIDDDVLYRAFVSFFNAVIENKDYFMAKWQEMLKEEDFLKKVTAKRFIGIFDRCGKIESFDEELYLKIVEKFVIKEGEVFVTLLDKSEVKCEIKCD